MGGKLFKQKLNPFDFDCGLNVNTYLDKMDIWEKLCYRRNWIIGPISQRGKTHLIGDFRKKRDIIICTMKTFSIQNKNKNKMNFTFCKRILM